MSSTKKERDFHKKVKEEVYAIAHDIGVEEGEEKGIKKGEEKAKAEMAKGLIKLGIDDDTIMKVSGFSKEEIASLRKETI